MLADQSNADRPPGFRLVLDPIDSPTGEPKAQVHPKSAGVAKPGGVLPGKICVAQMAVIGDKSNARGGERNTKKYYVKYSHKVCICY